MYTLENHTIPVEDGEIRVRTVSPTPTADETSDFPILVYSHGRGWVVGSINSRDLVLRILSVYLRLAIVNVGYRLTPEHPFHARLNDCYAPLKWVHVEKGFIVCGASAGANLATAVPHGSLKDPFFKDRRITGNVLQIPMLVHPAAYPPHCPENKTRMLPSSVRPLWMYGLTGPPADPELSPLLADYNGLPPTHLQICGLNPLRDEGLLHERLLREQGILTRLDMWVHPFFATRELAHFPHRYPGILHVFRLTIQLHVTGNDGDQEVECRPP
ncbi:Alpha/Beta hydrolase protein [Mycena olivaceomarginata]|nr:Alpha/Beta hydrolase protein [Mycena olivaceomarginata]